MTRRSAMSVITFALSASLVAAPAGCGESGGFPGMGGWAAEMPEGIQADALPDPVSRGARLVATYCSTCHGIPAPNRHAAEEWESIVRRMVRRMEHMEHMGGMMGRGMMRGPMGRRMMMMADVRAPTPEEEREIVAYLERHALRSAEPEALPEAEGRESFVRACSRCHALPDPAQHAPEEWPAVVERMRENMRKMEVPEITDAEAQAIVRYLQEASARDRG